MAHFEGGGVGSVGAYGGSDSSSIESGTEFSQEMLGAGQEVLQAIHEAGGPQNVDMGELLANAAEEYGVDQTELQDFVNGAMAMGPPPPQGMDPSQAGNNGSGNGTDFGYGPPPPFPQGVRLA